MEIFRAPSVSGASVEESHDKLPVIEEFVQVRLLFRVTSAQRVKEQIAHYTVHHLLIAILPETLDFPIFLAVFHTLFLDLFCALFVDLVLVLFYDLLLDLLLFLLLDLLHDFFGALFLELLLDLLCALFLDLFCALFLDLLLALFLAFFYNSLWLEINFLRQAHICW